MNKSSRFSGRSFFLFFLLAVFVCLIKLNSDLSSPVYSSEPSTIPSYIELVVSIPVYFTSDNLSYIQSPCKSVAKNITDDCSVQFRFTLFSYESFVSTVLKSGAVPHTFVTFLHKLFIPANSSDNTPLTLA